MSMILDIVKFIWEQLNNRTRIEVGRDFRDRHNGNKVIIRNVGNAPIIITNWELFQGNRRGYRWKESKRIADQYDLLSDYSDLKLEGYKSVTLEFGEDNYFDWSHAALGTDQIYIRLYIAGKRRPVVREVYDGRY